MAILVVCSVLSAVALAAGAMAASLIVVTPTSLPGSFADVSAGLKILVAGSCTRSSSRC